MEDMDVELPSDQVGELRDMNTQLTGAKAELEAWKSKVERADDRKARLLLEKLQTDDEKKNLQEEVTACMEQQQRRQKEMSRCLAEMKDGVQVLDERRRELAARLKKLQDELEARRVQSSTLKQKFKICTHIPETDVNFVRRHHGEEPEVGDSVTAGVFTISQRVAVPLRGGQALITFEEEKVASQVLKLAKCAMPYESSTLEVTPTKVAMDPVVKFEVHLDVSREALAVSNVPPSMDEERVKDRLQISFSRPSRGGVEVDRVEYDKNTGTGRVVFLRPGATESLILRGKYQVELDPEVSVQVGPEFSYKLRRFQTFCGSARRTVLLDHIQDVPDTVDEEDVQDLLEIYFQKPSNRGGEIETIKYLSGGKALRALFCEDSGQAAAAATL